MNEVQRVLKGLEEGLNGDLKDGELRYGLKGVEG